LNKLNQGHHPVISTSPDPAKPSPEQLWTKVLAQLKLQMTRATFETWLQDTWLISANNGTWQVAVKSNAAKETLEHRLLKVICRTVTNLVNQTVELEFVVAEPRLAPVEQIPDEVVSPPPPSLETEPADQADRGLAVDVRLLNRTGYHPLTHYYPRFIEPYLCLKWHTSGQKAYTLWEKLTALDPEQYLHPDFCNWTRPLPYRMKGISDRMANTNNQSLTGRYGYCARFSEAKKERQPFTECCGQYQPDCEFRPGRHCRHWVTGILEVLSEEGMLSVEEYGGRKNYGLKIQVWRSWPILSRHQVSTYFAAAMQTDHKGWLKKHGATIDLSWEQWLTETVQSGIEQYPDREAGRECWNPFRRDPFHL
jgi:DnaA N-terminal domain